MTAVDRFSDAKAVADAVLYEGYVLYPYRASSAKNQLRWQFGVLVPESASSADASERSVARTECVVRRPAGSSAPELRVRVRFLQPQLRLVEAASEQSGHFEPVERLEVDGRLYVTWDEAHERVVDLEPLVLRPDAPSEKQQEFEFPDWTQQENICGGDGRLKGRVLRTRQSVAGLVRVAAEPAVGGAIKLRVTVSNTSPWVDSAASREEIVRRSMAATHTMLALDGGLFESSIDPEVEVEAVSECESEGTFPVLIGDGSVMLSSPIILYDRPAIAAESPGDLFDSTEIDEILALRVVTLTDAEKAEARATDSKAGVVIDRCDAMSPDVWERLHGTIRSLESIEAGRGPQTEMPAMGAAMETEGEPPAAYDPEVPWWDPGEDASVDPENDSVVVDGVEISKGSAVVLRPSRRADAHDLFLAGLDATVAGVFKTVDGDTNVAVTVDDDPATEELAWQGRYLYFCPEELEPVSRSRRVEPGGSKP